MRHSWQDYWGMGMGNLVDDDKGRGKGNFANDDKGKGIAKGKEEEGKGKGKEEEGKGKGKEEEGKGTGKNKGKSLADASLRCEPPNGYGTSRTCIRGSPEWLHKYGCLCKPGKCNC